MPSSGPSEHLLCFFDHPAGTGYAWDFIGPFYSAMAGRLRTEGVRTTLSYPIFDGVPDWVDGDIVRAEELPWRDGSDLPAISRFIEDQGVTAVCVTDRSAWHPAYRRFRAAGARRVILHDHTSGHRTRPGPVKRWVKRVRQRLPGSTVDGVIAVSGFVARRHREVELLPSSRVHVVHNAVRIPTHHLPSEGRRAMRRELAIPDTALLAVAAARLVPEKGIRQLLEAFDRLREDGTVNATCHLAILGDGPEREHLESLRKGLASGDQIHLCGYVGDTGPWLAAADVTVVPSIWDEAFGMVALESMAHGVPVIASRVGGLPEVVRHEREGLLVEPGHPARLAHAIAKLLSDVALRRTLGEAARRRAEQRFEWNTQVQRLSAVVRSILAAQNPVRTPSS